jgi:hypothetical protein
LEATGLPKDVPADAQRLTQAEILGQRRHFLVHRRSQLRAALLATGLALAVVVPLNLVLHAARSQATAAAAGDIPELAAVLNRQARFELMLSLVASAVFLGGIFVVTVLETHRTAGAACRIRRELDRLCEGPYGASVGLRRGDNLQEVAETLNRLSRTLADRAERDVLELEHLSRLADRISAPPEARELAVALRGMAEVHRRLVTPPGR